MINTIVNDLEKLDKKIKSSQYLDDLKKITDDGHYQWGGAGVIIAQKMTPNLERFINEQPSMVINVDFEAPDFVDDIRRIVLTPYSYELSWLFYELKNIFKDYIDFRSKFQFYGLLAQSANDFINKHNEEYDSKSLLSYVLENGAWMYIKLNKQNFKGIS